MFVFRGNERLHMFDMVIVRNKIPNDANCNLCWASKYVNDSTKCTIITRVLSIYLGCYTVRASKHR